MLRYKLPPAEFPENVLAAYDGASRHLKSRADRFSTRALANFAATALRRRPLAIAAATADGPAEILLYDEIGYWGVTAKDFVLALAQAGDGPLTLRINSPGGDVFDGYAIYNALRARATPVDVIIDGIAASAASFIAMAGASVTMGETSMMMIHNAWGGCFGDRRDMSATADLLGKIDGQIAAIYAQKAGATTNVAQFADAMDSETWLTGAEAKRLGLCDNVLEPASSAPIDPAARTFAPLHARAGAGAKNLADPYDPDGDGDNDAQEALDCLDMATTHLGRARDCLTGAGGNPEQRATRLAAAAAAISPEAIAAAAAAALVEAETECAVRSARAMRDRLRIAEAELV
jgi:ATP-dependent Clp protease protease subunit